MAYDDNPFLGDPDREAIWEMLMRRDIDAYLAHDWSRVADDFIADAFMGIDAKGSEDPDRWQLGFPTLESYRESWLAGTIEQKDFAEPLRPALFRCSRLDAIDVAGGRALGRKKFSGAIRRADGGEMRLGWQSLYYLRHHGGRWRIFGFTGYLPNGSAA